MPVRSAAWRFAFLLLENGTIVQELWSDISILNELDASSEFRGFKVSWGPFIHAQVKQGVTNADGTTTRELEEIENELTEAPISLGTMVKLLSSSIN